jgi:hypothetical protein
VGYTNLRYEGTEVDGLVVFEDLAIVVEGKGSRLSFQAHRGDIKRLKSEMEDGAQEAWEQGARARNFILRGGDAVFHDSADVEIRIPAGSVREVIIVNATLHELGGHAPQIGRLRSLGLFPKGELPWSVYINDLRVIAETCGNAAVFLHYIRWRGRLPLGDRIVVSDELDLWGCYLNGERFGTLPNSGKWIVGNSTTDLDAYYDGLVGRAPKRARPEKFLREPVKSFVERMAAERPTGWHEAAGVCLDLTLAELALVTAKAGDIARFANEDGGLVEAGAGRVALVGLPGRSPIATAVADTSPHGDAILVLYCREGKSRGGEIVWAKYAKDVTLELSDFEKEAQRELEASHQT